MRTQFTIDTSPVTALPGEVGSWAVIVSPTPSETTASRLPRAVEAPTDARETKARDVAATDVLAMTDTPPTKVVCPILAFVPSAIRIPFPIPAIMRSPAVMVRVPEVSPRPPAPLGVIVIEMSVFVPVADQEGPASRVDTVAAPVVRFVTEGVKDPPRESQVADPEELAVKA